MATKHNQARILPKVQFNCTGMGIFSSSNTAMVGDLQDAETLDTEYLVPDITLMLSFTSTF